MSKRRTTKEFIKESIDVHGSFYDYSLVVFKNTSTKVKIICPIHGMFEQVAYSHLIGCKCKKCSCVAQHIKQRHSITGFIQKAKEVHGDKYNYSLVNYENNSTKIKINCTHHGTFLQTPHSHLSGSGCPKCGSILAGEKCKLLQEEFIKRSNDAHKNIYDYSLVEYVKNNRKVKIICPTHGEFFQTPSSHMTGIGCSKCGHGRTAGENHHNYKDGKAKERANTRKDAGYIKWLKIIKDGKEYCECCETKFMEGNKAVAHHLNAYYSYPDQRTDPSNGVCICEECHMEFHAIYNRGTNTKHQYQLFKEMKALGIDWGVA